MRLDGQIEALATRQHALVATWQLDALGASSREILRLRAGPRWVAITPRVFGLRGVGDTPDRWAMAAVLDASPGAALSHTSAAAMWGAPGFRAEPHQVTRHRGVARRVSPLARVHEVKDLRPHHLKLMRGILLTSPARTVFDLAAQLHCGRLERVVDWFWSERLLDGAALMEIASELCRRGRTGSAAMRAVVAERGADYVPPASSLERRFAQILAERALPRMQRQVDVGGTDWTGRVDFRDRVLPLVVEVQSERYHSALVDVASDLARRTQLETDGLVVLEVWDTEVWHQPEVVAQRVRSARSALSMAARLVG